MMEQFEKKAEQIVDKDAVAEQSRHTMVREALSSAGLNNFESALDAVTDFLTDLKLFDPDVAFGRAADALFIAAGAFDAIDTNHDQRLSKKELNDFARRADEYSAFPLDWILMHFDSIGKAFGDETEGVSVKDLTYAGSFMRGLDFAHKNFDKLSMLDGEPFLSPIDIEKFLIMHEKQLDPRQRQGLIQLAMYLRNVAQKEGRSGITDEELAELDPEALWKQKARKA